MYIESVFQISLRCVHVKMRARTEDRLLKYGILACVAQSYVVEEFLRGGRRERGKEELDMMWGGI